MTLTSRLTGARLVLADERAKQARDLATYAAWGAPLSLEGYLAREARLRAHPWSRTGMRTWLLEGARGEVLTSCETFRTVSQQPGADGPVEVGESHAIASVFTEPQLRGHGFASELMRQLVERLAREEARLHSALLFSDVGAALYERSGYVAFPAWDWCFPAQPQGSAACACASVQERELAQALSRLSFPADRFCYRPTVEQVDWHLERERIYAEHLGRPRPAACGAVTGEDGTVFWMANPRAQTLYVLVLQARTPEQAAELIASAQAAAAEAGLAHVTVWETPELVPLLAGVPDGSRLEREGSLPMVAPLSPGLSLPDTLALPRVFWV